MPASAAERAKLSQLPFRAACGKFIYLRHTKPECAYAISQVCRFASTPTKQAWQQCRRIAQYAYNTRHRGVKFTRTTDVSELLSVRAFADASFLDCPDTARSTGGYCVFFCGNLIAFESKRLPLVTLSTAESEYVEATRCATEVAYIKELCRDFNIDLDTVPIMEDNTACIAISANPVHHQRTKHIAKYYHYCRDLVLAGEIELVGVGTKYQIADIFTKPLERDTFRRLSSVLNGYRSYAQLLVDAPTASIATMLQKTSDYANQVYHSLADHDLARRPGFRAGFARIRARGRGARGSVGAACSSRKKPLDCRLAIQLSSNLLSSKAASLRGRPVFPCLLCVPTTWCANDGTVDSTTSTPVIESTATSRFSGILPLKHVHASYARQHGTRRT